MRSLLSVALAPLLLSAAPSPATYGEADFARIPKFDAHVHANVADPALLSVAKRDGFELLSINVD